MRTITVSSICVLVVALAGFVFAHEASTAKAIPQLDQEKLPGRQVKVAAICISIAAESRSTKPARTARECSGIEECSLNA